MNSFDVVIIGGGVVGLSAALLASQQGLSVAIVEAHAPSPWQAESPDLRVVALALDNQKLFQSLGLWQTVIEKRAFAYSSMTVFDEVQTSPLQFRANEIAQTHLGYIVENALLLETLWKAVLANVNIRCFCPDKISEITHTEAVAIAVLQSGVELRARVLIGADGASSKVRTLLNIAVDEKAYQQKGVVAFVELEKNHENTAWQRFIRTGPLAILPFGEKLCSIVWTLPSEMADVQLQTDEVAFCTALERAIGGQFGTMRLRSKRAAFPLKRQLAKQMLHGRCILMGDAAHAVHPLAGQGVNLGLRDVKTWCNVLIENREKTGDALHHKKLQIWANERYSENAFAAYAFENINRIFSNDHVALSLIRGHALGLSNKLSPLKNIMSRYAAGV